MWSLLVPLSSDLDPHRARVWSWLEQRWRHHHPDVEIVVGRDAGRPFSKTRAVNDAASRASGDVFGVLDADAWVHAARVREAVQMIRDGVPWVIPHTTVYRLGELFTETLLGCDPSIRFPQVPAAACDRITPTSLGMLYLIPRNGWEAVGGMDPRFAGWGWEDNVLMWVLDLLWGRHRTLGTCVFHLWHERHYVDGRPAWEGQQDRNATLGRRYKAARRDRDAMAELVAEVKAL